MSNRYLLLKAVFAGFIVQQTFFLVYFHKKHYTAALGLNLKSFIISKIVIIFDLNFPFRARSAAASIAATGPSMAAQTSAGKELAHCSTVFRSGQIIEVAPVDWKKGINKVIFIQMKKGKIFQHLPHRR